MKPAISGLNRNSLFPFWVLFQRSTHHRCDFRALEKVFLTSEILSVHTDSAQLPEVSINTSLPGSGQTDLGPRG